MTKCKYEQDILDFLKLSSNRADKLLEKSKQNLSKQERKILNQEIQEFDKQYNGFIELLNEKFNLGLSDFSTLWDFSYNIWYD